MVCRGEYRSMVGRDKVIRDAWLGKAEVNRLTCGG